MDKQLFPTSEGTPQGGVISPLLANIALHGMENLIGKIFPTKNKGKAGRFYSPCLVRYADDLVILHEDIAIIQRCQEIISEWLKDMNLELKPSKTRLVHTLKQYEQEKPGFNFLGFNIRQFPAGKNQSGKLANQHGDITLGFKTLITPSKEKRKVHYDHIAGIIDSHKSAPQVALIQQLNPIIRGWANYYATVVSKKTYAELDNLVYQKLRAWAKRRHPNKSGEWVSNKYWHTIGNDNWVFATRKGDNPIRLLDHSATKIKRHAKVKGESSPYDGNLVYWSTRMGNNPEMPKRVSTLLKRQDGRCTHCKLYFRESDVMEIDHKIPKSKGGKDCYDNWQLLHRHCHDTKTAEDYMAVGTKSDCNSVEPKPTSRLEKVQDKWVIRYV